MERASTCCTLPLRQHLESLLGAPARLEARRPEKNLVTMRFRTPDLFLSSWFLAHFVLRRRIVLSLYMYTWIWRSNFKRAISVFRRVTLRTPYLISFLCNVSWPNGVLLFGFFFLSVSFP